MVKMMASSMMLSLLVVSLLFQRSYSATILVDGVSEWINTTVNIGDSIIFRHKWRYNLYIFQNQIAFNTCNFTRATLLTTPSSSTYTWHPSRPGFFYFAFHNGSLASSNQQCKKLSVTVSPPSPPPELPSPAASPTSSPVSGLVVPSSPAFPWPFHPREAASSSPPSPEPSVDIGASSPMSLVSDHKGGGKDGHSGNGNTPFINSNPAVPLPTGEVDSATIRPLPTSAASGFSLQVEFGLHMTLLCVVLLLPLTMN